METAGNSGRKKGHGKLRFHFNTGQTKAVHTWLEFGDDTVVPPKCPEEYRRITSGTHAGNTPTMRWLQAVNRPKTGGPPRGLPERLNRS